VELIRPALRDYGRVSKAADFSNILTPNPLFNLRWKPEYDLAGTGRG